MQFLRSAFVAIVVVSAEVPISSSTPYRLPGNTKASPSVRGTTALRQAFSREAQERGICANVMLSGAERRKRTLWPSLVRIS